MSSIYERRDNGDGSYSTNTAITDVDAIIPMGIEYRKQKMVPAFTSAVVPATTGTATSPWIDTDGFNDLGITLLNDAGTSNSLDLQWSNDGSALHGKDYPIAPAAGQYKAATVPTKARYVKVIAYNNDAAPHTMNCWLYLKA
jgi:hypothetical protein